MISLLGFVAQVSEKLSICVIRRVNGVLVRDDFGPSQVGDGVWIVAIVGNAGFICRGSLSSNEGVIASVAWDNRDTTGPSLGRGDLIGAFIVDFAVQVKVQGEKKQESLKGP